MQGARKPPTGAYFRWYVRIGVRRATTQMGHYQQPAKIPHAQSPYLALWAQ